jgi:hypothetical protein
MVLAVLIDGRPGLTDGEHVDTADCVAVDRGLVEAGQRTLGHDFFGAHQPLRLGDRNANRPRRHGSGRHPGLLLLHRTHSAPFCRHSGAGTNRAGRR